MIAGAFIILSVSLISTTLRHWHGTCITMNCCLLWQDAGKYFEEICSDLKSTKKEVFQISKDQVCMLTTKYEAINIKYSKVYLYCGYLLFLTSSDNHIVFLCLG